MENKNFRPMFYTSRCKNTSIVIVGRHDNFSAGFENRTQNFITGLEHGLKRHPLARIELVFVEYAPYPDKSPLSEVIKIPDILKEKVRFITVPLSTHQLLQKKLNTSMQFLEYVAKNIGVRRARGTFILTTNPDNLIPSPFFQMVADEDFNPAILYRTIRWDTRENTLAETSIEDLLQHSGEADPSFDGIDVRQRCQRPERFAVHDSMDSIERGRSPAAPATS